VGSNVVPVVIDNGPAAAQGSIDVPFISITLCVPGTSTCQTIDHVAVDTGSSGTRIISSVLTLSLPQVNAADGHQEAECFAYADGYVWGAIRTVDLKIAGEVAASIPIQIMADPSVGAAPSDCSNQGSAEDTVAAFGSNGIIGINQIVPDCGDYCASGPQSGSYYSCTGGTCSNTTVADAKQVSNPIAFFSSKDTNGAVMQIASVPAGGAATGSGTITFGIGTQANNGLGSAKVTTLDENGNFSTMFNGATFSTSFIDSGTNTLTFNDNSIPQCTSEQSMGFDCPTSTLNLMATNTGQNNVSIPVTFAVGNADTIFGTGNTASDDLATPGIDNDTFDWGFPFFFGRSVFIGLDGAATPGGTGPYVAY
jgi:hypothetical protein